MKRRTLLQTLSGVFGTMSLKRVSIPDPLPPSITGAWHLQSIGAPMVHHALCFLPAGIVTSFQADGGFPSDSESNGAGMYQVRGSRITGAFEEYRYDRTTHAYLGWVRLEFSIVLTGNNTFTGNAQGRAYDENGNMVAEASPIWTATRITL